MSDPSAGNEHADSGWDNYNERVLRNEGELHGLQFLVAETREADRKLIEQRSESLARELERRAEALLELVTARADAVLAIGREERQADLRAIEVWKAEHEKLMLTMRDATREEAQTHRDTQEQRLHQNYEQSREAINALEQRRIAATDKIEQMVRQWRESDKEARELFAADLKRHLDSLNHYNERLSSFQAGAVTRELWQAEKDAAIIRESLLRDQIISLEKALLTMTPIALSDKVHSEMLTRTESSIASLGELLGSRIGVLDEKIADLRETRSTLQGKSAGYTNLYGWVIAAGGLGVSVIVAAVIITNAFFAQ